MVRKISFREAISEADSIPTYSVINIDRETESNREFRKPIWTGEYLSITVMRIPVNGETGNEIHDDTDQFVKIESGDARIAIGDENGNVIFDRAIDDDYGVVIPAGTWHNIINAGNEPLKLLSVYAPPH